MDPETGPRNLASLERRHGGCVDLALIHRRAVGEQRFQVFDQVIHFPIAQPERETCVVADDDVPERLETPIMVEAAGILGSLEQAVSRTNRPARFIVL
jgi:hypothetical protein